MFSGRLPLNVVDLWLFLDESEKWLQNIGVEEAQKVRKILQLPISSGFFMSHEGGYPYLNICYCQKNKKNIYFMWVSMNFSLQGTLLHCKEYINSLLSILINHTQAQYFI